MKDYASALAKLSPEKQALLALRLKKAQGEPARRTGIPPRGDRGAPAPLSFAQERLWFLSQLDVGGAYNDRKAFALSGELDVAVLGTSFDEIRRRHEVLRTVFLTMEDSPVQVVREPEPAGVPVVDLSALPSGERAAELARIGREQGERPFDLAAESALRATLARIGGREHVLFLTMHHIVTDGWSWEVLLREVALLYNALSRREAPRLPALPIQYADFAAWQRRHLPDLEAQLSWWTGALAGAPRALPLPTDRPRPARQTFQGAEVPFELAAGPCGELRELCGRESATLFMGLLAAYGALLGRMSGQEDVLVGSPTAGRRWPETEPLIGVFINTLVMRTDLSGEPTFRGLLSRVRAWTLQAFDHQDLPFERLVDALGLPRDLSRSPLFQVLFVVQNTTRRSGADLGTGLHLEPYSLAGASAKLDLELSLQDQPGALPGFLEYSTDLFDRSTAVRLLRGLETLLAAAVAAPDRPLAELPLLGEAERFQLLREWNDTAAARPAATVHRLVAAQAARTPDAVAVEAPDGCLTYRELAERAGRLAGHLLRLGVGPEDRVGISLPPSVDVPVALLGVLAAGGAYVPLDPAYPAERLRLMAEDSGASVVLTAETLRSLDSVEVEEGFSAPESLAYVLYTSGSTGRPKGVQVSHAALVNLLLSMLEEPGLGSGDVLLSVASLSFDIAELEIYLPLLAGARVVLASREEAQDGALLAARLAACGASVLQATPATWRLLVEAGWQGGPDFKVLSGGEAMPRDLADELLARAGEVWNLYGPTETTIYSTGHRVLPGKPLSIGRPIANTRTYVADSAGRPLPVGAPGELLVGGAGVARGYLGRPDLTAERFVPDPFGGPGARLYRTGDFARVRPDGEIEYLGRLDHQVKVRGFRIEPGEVEAALGQHPAVSRAVVVAREARLVAYVVAPDVEAAELKAFLRERLPEPLVPSVFVFLPSLPLTPNGKVDRKALPAPELQATVADYAPPRNPVEETLAELWAEVLGVARVGIDDDFFALGGHSLLATRVASRAARTLGGTLPVRWIFEEPTVRGLAARIAPAGADEEPPVVPVPRTEDTELPLSFSQQRLWFLDWLEPGSSGYNIPFVMRLEGALDVGALEGALAGIVRRHEILRTTFPEVEGRPRQRIAPAPPGRILAVVDLAALPEALREAERERQIREEISRPFHLAAGPLLRCLLVRLGEGEQILALTAHHIVCDAWSFAIFIRELSELYRGGAELPALPVQYADFAAWQRSWMTGETLDRLVAGWRARLAGIPAAIELPTDRPYPPVQTFRGARVPFRISPETTSALHDLARAEGASLFMVLLAGFSALLGRWSGQEDVVVGAPIAGRTRPEVEPLIGLFINNLALRGDLSGDPPFRGLLARVREAALEAYELQDLPFEKLVEELQPPRNLARPPLFQVMLGLQNAPSERLDLPGLALVPLPLPTGTAKYELNLQAHEAADGGLGGFLEYNRDLYDGVTAQRFIVHLENLLTAGPGQPLLELPLLAPGERWQVLAEWNDTEGEYDREATIHELFEAWVERTPEAVAVAAPGEDLTYRELDARANRLARRLAERGLGPGDFVGIRLDRSPGMAVALLGVLKSGAAYVPLDPGYPEARIEWIRSALSIRCVVTRELMEGLGDLPVERLGRRADAGDLAYVIFTSGTTGTPKGVMVRHRAAVNLIDWVNGTFGVGPGDRVLFVTSLGFDLSVYDVLGLLAAGGSVRVATDGEVRDPERLVRILTDEPVTFWDSAPAALQQLVPLFPEEPAGESRLRLAFLSGDWIPLPLPDEVRRAFPGARVVSLGGATEATVWSNFFPVEAVDPAWPSIPYGRPIRNARYHVLDAALSPCPVLVPGDLYIGGECLAAGYIPDPSLTASKFIPDPWSPVRGGRLYRTGDRARFKADGNLEFLGRRDQQVKVRGFRIELGEIESVLLAHPGVHAAVVLARRDAAGLRLVAYVVPEEGTELTAAALREIARERLPEYMVPAAWMILDALPMTANGKLDRRALPEPGIERAAEEAPRGAVEETLSRLFGELLGLPPVGTGDDFFALGGHSILATQLLARVRSAFGVEMPLRQIFQTPTVAGLAAALGGSREGAVRRLRPGPAGEGPFPVSFSQRRLWFVDRLEAGSPFFNIATAVRLDGPLDAAALGRALSEVVRRHETLRTVFAEQEGEPVQVILPPAPVALPVVDLSGDEEARLRVPEAARRPFDLARGPLLRAELFRMGESRHVLLLAVHHTVADWLSLGILVREVTALYEGADLPGLPVQYRDFAAWQREWLRGETLEEHLRFWRERLAGAPRFLDLPTDRPYPPAPTWQGAREPFSWPAAQGLLALAAAEGCTPFMAALAVWQALLSEVSGSEDVVVSSPVGARDFAETEPLIGLFVNTLLFRTSFAGDPTFREVLARVRDGVLAAFAHQHLPVERVIEEVAPAREPGRTPLLQSSLNFLEREAASGGADLAVSPFEVETGVAQFDLNLIVRNGREGLAGSLQYRTELFDRGTIASLLAQLGRLVELVAARPEIRRSEIREALRQEEKEKLGQASLQKLKAVRRKAVGI